jgi:hypothetical protein
MLQSQSQVLSETVIAGLELMVKDYLAKKGTTIELSDASVAAKDDLMEMLDLVEKGANWLEKKPAAAAVLPAPPPIDGFSWLPGPEDCMENRTAYMAYLQDILQIPAQYALADVQPNKMLLTVELFRGEMPKTRKISGTTDVVIAKIQHVHNKAIRHNIEILLQVKKPHNMEHQQQQQKNDDGHTPQMIGQHFAASYLNRYHAVVSVWTDLNQNWTFCWFAAAAAAAAARDDSEDDDDAKQNQDQQRMALYKLRLTGEQAAADAKYLLDSLYNKNSDTTRRVLPSTFANRLPMRAVMDCVVRNQMVLRRKRSSLLDQHRADSKKPSSSPSPFSGGGGGGGAASGQHPPTTFGTTDDAASAAPENNKPGAAAAASGGGGDDDDDAPKMSMASALSLFAPPADRDVANELDLLDMVDDVDEQYEIVRRFAEKHIVPYMTGSYKE